MSETKSIVRQLADKHGRTRESLLPILQDYISEQHHVSKEAMNKIAEELDLSAAQVYGTTSFYSFLDIIPRGKYTIRICKTITCDMHGKREIVNAIEALLKIKLGETTHDNKFTLLETNCLGQCHKGPAMLINEEVYTELTPERISEILLTYIEK